MGHRQLLLEENRPQLWGWHPCIQAEEPEMPQEAVNPEASPACPQILQPKAIPQPPHSLRRLLFTHLLPPTGMLAKTNGPCETLETKRMKTRSTVRAATLPAAEACPGPGTDRLLTLPPLALPTTFRGHTMGNRWHNAAHEDR